MHTIKNPKYTIHIILAKLQNKTMLITNKQTNYKLNLYFYTIITLKMDP